MKKNIIIVASVAILIIAIGGYFYPNVTERVIEKITLGASPGPDRANPCESRDGVEQCFKTFVARNLITIVEETSGEGIGTSTICAILSPTATSTLVRGSVSLSTGATTTADYNFAKTSDRFASTTRIGSIYSNLANTGVDLMASSTGTEAEVFPPSNYFIVKVGGVGNSFSPVGNCNATFEIQ